MIVDRADRFGLAQLYQLRGRIGRSRERAFCYLLVPRGDAHDGRGQAAAGGAAAVHRARRRLPDRVARPRDPRRRRAARRAPAVGRDRRGRLRDLRAHPRGGGRRAAGRADQAASSIPSSPSTCPASSPTTTCPTPASGSTSTSGSRRRATRTTCARRWPSSPIATARCPTRRVLLGEVMVDKTLVRALGALGLRARRRRASCCRSAADTAPRSRPRCSSWCSARAAAGS